MSRPLLGLGAVLAALLVADGVRAAATTAATPATALVVHSVTVTVEGVGWTRPEKIREAMDLSPGMLYDPGILDEDLQRLWDYEIFQSVTAEVHTTTAGVDVHVRVRDRWGIIPLFRPAFGGGVLNLMVGVRDTNFLGRNAEAALFGGVYASDASQSWLAGGWLIERQFIDRHYMLLQIQRVFTADRFYEGQTTAATILEKETKEGYLEVRYRISDTLWPGFFLYGADRRYRPLRGAPLDPDLPDNLLGIRSGALLQAGRVRYRRFRYTGGALLLGGFYEWRRPEHGPFAGGFLQARGFLLPTDWLNLAGRIQAEFRNNRFRVDDLAYGGFDTVRGYPDRYLRGDKSLLVNLEGRFVLADALFGIFFLQGTLFSDIAWIGRAPLDELLPAPNHTVGAGIRVGVVQVYGMYMRLDVGRSLTRGDLGWDVSISNTQFF